MNGNLCFKILVQSENICVIRSKIHLEALRTHKTQYSKIRKKNCTIFQKLNQKAKINIKKNSFVSSFLTCKSLSI